MIDITVGVSLSTQMHHVGDVMTVMGGSAQFSFYF